MALVMMKKFLTDQEASEYIGLSLEEFQGIVKQGDIPSYRIGGVYTRFKVDDLNLYRRISNKKFKNSYSNSVADIAKDFFYFNDFYIFSSIAIAVILYFIFK